MTRVLVLTPRFPWPMDSGDKLRIGKICAALSARAEVTLLSLHDSMAASNVTLPGDIAAQERRVFLPKWQSRLQAALAAMGRTPLQVAYYQSARFGDLVREHAASADVVVAHLIRTAPYAIATGLPRMLEMTDSPSLFYGRSRAERIGTGKGLVYTFEAARVAAYELEVCRQFDVTTVVSSVDRTHLLGRGLDGSRILSVGNGVDLDRPHLESRGERNELLFIGNMRTLQNQDACRYLVDELLPRLNRHRPIKLRIVGAVPDVLPWLSNSPHVVLHGYADDLASAARDALCGICIMRVAAGIQNKILDYMSIGLPTLVNAMALEGLPAAPGRDLLLADSPEEQAAAILDLADNDSLWTDLSAAGLEYVASHHHWNQTLEPFVEAVLALGAPRPAKFTRVT